MQNGSCFFGFRPLRPGQTRKGDRYTEQGKTQDCKIMTGDQCVSEMPSLLPHLSLILWPLNRRLVGILSINRNSNSNTFRQIFSSAEANVLGRAIKPLDYSKNGYLLCFEPLLPIHDRRILIGIAT
jgi:hypothetical protein